MRRSVRNLLANVKSASGGLRLLAGDVRSQMLEVIADAIPPHIDFLLAENAKDCLQHASSLEPALADRLKLTEDKLHTLVAGIR
jgi:gamma-glutamyl phosphate reductase